MKSKKLSPDFERLLAHLKEARGFDFGVYKPTTLSRRIEKRMGAVGINSFSDYIDFLEVHPDEFGELFNAILINVTSFFRDTETFDYVRDVIVPAILAGKGADDPIRVWSAGCASGEEAYSIAIIFGEALGDRATRERVKIYATDVDEDALASARQAIYTDRQVEAVPPDLRQKYFGRAGSHWSFKKDYRRTVIFGRHELLEDAPISRVDLLLCRNTLMYFNQDAQARIVARFHFALRDAAFLVLGKAEMLLNFADVFEAVDIKRRIFRKLPGSALPRDHTHGAPAREDRPAVAASHRLREISFDEDPVAQVVLDARGSVLLANTRARDLFGVSARDIGRPLQDLEMSYRPIELRSCIDDAHSRRQTIQIREIAWPTSAGDPRFFTVQVTPVFDGAESSLGTKIRFVDVTRQHELQDELQRSRQELETAYEELQSTNEELETTNEELQSTIEELETTNEELQSTNEELETMNEELQSTNEELEALNLELRQRGIDLSRTNIFLRGILRSVPLGVVVMNDDLQIELWNDVAADMWGLRQDEVKGKHFLGLDIGLPVEQLRQPLLALRHTPDSVSESTVQATNRRGRPMRVRVLCASAGGADADGHGVILLLQETEQSVS
jgi:two-component system, chemotaxis family, CheB/CheR fusion protein